MKTIEEFNTLISKFYNEVSLEGRYSIINDIFFFKNQRETVLCLNKLTNNTELIEAPVKLFNFNQRDYTKNSILLRGRKTDVPILNAVIQDFWEPRAENTKKYRLNKAGEPELYVSNSLDAIEKELKVSNNDVLNLIFYRVVEEFSVIEFGFQNNAPKDQIDKAIEDFFNKLLLTSGEAIYDISYFISRRYLDVNHDGWVYPSVANNLRGDNICLKLKAKKNLELIGAFAFMDRKPIAMYDFSDLSDIKTINIDHTNEVFGDFLVKNNPFGSVTVKDNPEPLFLVKEIKQLDSLI